jgi:hypothetical protein
LARYSVGNPDFFIQKLIADIFKSSVKMPGQFIVSDNGERNTECIKTAMTATSKIIYNFFELASHPLQCC